MHDTPGPRLRPIVIRGARTHNLKNVDVTLAPRRLTVVTGVSGSGKSSLAFDTIYAEGQRRYVESLSAYARQFLERMERPDVDSVEGMPPAIAIRQKNSVRNPRSTVGTTTEIHDYLRLLFARVGRTVCRQLRHATSIRETAEAVAERLAHAARGRAPAARLRDADRPRRPARRGRGRTRAERAGRRSTAATTTRPSCDLLEPPPPADPVAATLDVLRRKGFARLLVDGQRGRTSTRSTRRRSPIAASLEVIVDRIQRRRRHARRGSPTRSRSPISKAAARRSRSSSAPATAAARCATCSASASSAGSCGIAYELPQPRLFSFNNPFGACPTCHGFGNVMELDLGLVVPDPSKTLQQGAIEPWTKPHYRAQLGAMKRAAQARPTSGSTCRGASSPSASSDVVLRRRRRASSGVHGFFQWLERKKYKVHIRVFLEPLSRLPDLPRLRAARGCAARRATCWSPAARSIASARLTVREAGGVLRGARRSRTREATIAEKVLREIRAPPGVPRRTSASTT